MLVAQLLENYLEQHNLGYRVHPHTYETSFSALCQEMGIEATQFATAAVLQTRTNATLMAIAPLSHSLDLNRLRALLQRDFDYASDEIIRSRFNGLLESAIPPVPGAFGLPCIVDRTLLGQHRIFMCGGSHEALISLDAESLELMYSRYPKAVISTLAVSKPVITPGADDRLPQYIHQVHCDLEKLDRLPAIPALAFKIIEQVADPDTSAGELAETIELDPSVAAQIVRYASSPYFGYRGRLDSVQDAITRVLGFELVSNIALGIASGKVFNAPSCGPLGLKAYWKHALCAALLAQGLARKINKPDVVSPGQAYLCGLLHNIGVLVIAHMFPGEFNRLNRVMVDQVGISLSEAERDLLNVGHDHIGGYMLEKWRLPKPVVNSAYFHHDEAYRGEDEQYVQLVRLANHLLAQQEIGDLGYDTLDLQTVCNGLISVADAQGVAESVMEMGLEIDSLADCIAA